MRGRQRKLLVRLNLVGSGHLFSSPVQVILPQASLACLGLKICLVLSSTYRLGRRRYRRIFPAWPVALVENGPAPMLDSGCPALSLGTSHIPHCQIKA